MSGIKETLKDGWHPKGKEGGKESWRGDFKGINQVVCICYATGGILKRYANEPLLY